MPYYNFQKIRDGVYHITSKEGSFCQLLIGRDKALLFDTAYGYGALRSQIEEITKLPLVVVNSHGHPDHINGNYQFPGPVYISKRDYEMALEQSSVDCRRYSAEGAKKYVTDRQKGRVEYILPCEPYDVESYANAKMPEFDFLEDGQIFDLGDIKLQVIAIPGHTKGCICLWEEKQKILLAGDSFSPFTWLFDENSGSLSEYAKGLRKVMAMKPKYILCGHEAESVEASELEAYLDAAEHCDYEKGMPWNPPIPGCEERRDIRVCARPGYVPFQFDKKGYASIVISPDHLK